MSLFKKIRSFRNKKIDPTIISDDQLDYLVLYLLETLDQDIKGDVVELGCYVGESSKYLAKTLVETNSDKKLHVYDSFKGLPDLSSFEESTGWKPRTLKTSKKVLKENFRMNNLPLPKICKAWFKDIPAKKLPEDISFAFLDGDFFESIYDSLDKIYNRLSEGAYVCIHDYGRNDLPGVKAAVEKFSKDHNLNIEPVLACDQLAVFRKNKEFKLLTMSEEKDNLTIVSGLWNIGREERKFEEHYLPRFKEFLEIPHPMILFLPKDLHEVVWEIRSEYNTRIIEYELDNIKQLYLPHWENTQKIRTSEEWLNMTGEGGWLRNSPQAVLEYYNPIVQSKMFMLHDASVFNNFNTEYFIWLDAGITNTVPRGHLVEDDVLSKIIPHLDPFLFLSYPYEAVDEIHGFEFEEMNRIAGEKVTYVCRGGLFGGRKEQIAKSNGIYYSLLADTLHRGYMGTEESIFSLMSYLYPHEHRRFELDANGLVVKFTEALDKEIVKRAKPPITRKQPGHIVTDSDIEKFKTNLYVLTFNHPEQFEYLVKSFENSPEWLERPSKYLLDNSTKKSARKKNKELAKKYGFEYIAFKENIGINGGRQFAAEHFGESDADYMFFFEDDMTLNGQDKEGQFCRNGLRKYVSNFYNRVHKVIKREGYDFVKLSFTEVFMDNNIQCAWYNVPQDVRSKVWPDYDKLPTTGLDPNAPLTKFNNIKVYDELSYIDGEIYYCNWPMIVSKEGNEKMFLTTKWAHPYEQTAMSYQFQETIKGNIKPAVLLLSPITHDRISHYKASERREN